VTAERGRFLYILLFSQGLDQTYMFHNWTSLIMLYLQYPSPTPCRSVVEKRTPCNSFIPFRNVLEFPLDYLSRFDIFGLQFGDGHAMLAVNSPRLLAWKLLPLLAPMMSDGVPLPNPFTLVASKPRN
jgi:hypothetical protein